MYSNHTKENPSPIERIIAALTYITFGFAGFIWFLIAIFTRKELKPYLKYHVFQSIFLSIGVFLFSQFFGLFLEILSAIPFLKILAAQTNFYLNMPLVFGYSITQTFVYFVMFYLVITSVQGYYSYIPWVSDIIKTNIGR